MVTTNIQQINGIKLKGITVYYYTLNSFSMFTPYISIREDTHKKSVSYTNGLVVHALPTPGP